MTALAEDGVAIEGALRAVQLAAGALASPKTRVSINQILWICREAMERSHDPFFAYRAGLRMRVSTFGLFGFAILTSTNFRQTVQVAAKYHKLTTPLAGISFREEAGCGISTVDPEPHPSIDARLYRFLVEMQFGIHVSLHRDVMGPAFKPTELRFSYAAPLAAQRYRDAFSCDALFGQIPQRHRYDGRKDERRVGVQRGSELPAGLRALDEHVAAPRRPKSCRDLAGGDLPRADAVVASLRPQTEDPSREGVAPWIRRIASKPGQYGTS
ncbi:MAG: AraC family transcriptional regulator [Roseiarcus sp.]